jgi:hypothetical protein
MKLSLYSDKKGFKWMLLGKILKIFDSKETHQELVKKWFKSIESFCKYLKNWYYCFVILIFMLF